MDETLSLPTEEAAKVALRTQQIIAEESGVTNTIDPLGGSYYLEKLTDEIESEALAYIHKIDEMGGMLRAVELGYPQHEIAEAAYQFQLRMERQEEIQVGVNKYADEAEQDIPLHVTDPEIERAQIERVLAFKKHRDQALHNQALQDIEGACRKGGNIMASLVEGVDRGVTLGEVSDIFRAVYGVYRDPGLV
jgi:methylmalonyl-CoA mutase N-terminal domain/subunit